MSSRTSILVGLICWAFSFVSFASFASAGEGGEAGVVAWRGGDEAAGEADGVAREAFGLLVRAPYDPERALSLLKQHDERLKPEQSKETGDITWPFARAFALARAGESFEAAAELEKLARRLRGDAGLDVQNVGLVTRVDAFGVYDEDTRRSYRLGDRLMAYAEVIGFACEPAAEAAPDVGEGQKEQPAATWRVSLEVELTLENRLTGERVASWGPDPVEHVTRCEVRDLHVTRVLDLPREMPPGEYELTLEVRDVLAEGVSGAGVRRLRAGGR